MARTVEPVRSLARGLEILRWLQEHQTATLHELHQGLSLPKPTLLRLLATLESSGFVWQGLGGYHASHTGRAASARLGAKDQLAEVAGPVLDWLMSRVRWPSDLSVRKATYMMLKESSRLRSYFDLHRLPLGFRINMLLSAPGRAYLAFCSEKERLAILSQLRKARDSGYALMGTEAAIARMIEDTRRCGYGTRDPRWGGDPVESKDQSDDGLMAIAVPIISGSKVLGCVNIVWIARVLKPAEIVKLHLADLREAANLIAVRHEGARPTAHALRTFARGGSKRS